MFQLVRGNTLCAVVEYWLITPKEIEQEVQKEENKEVNKEVTQNKKATAILEESSLQFEPSTFTRL